ncbi:MAG TPA: alpha/beta hydrolase [Hypericibacter adhaerens]|jgi:pimeloyl-ACP methyl ester carboxylesterase|uniref:3-oxoadipate enol-lactonase n=1 Tax=Hypericibacter adhaerens TaxID=2602016 RepID=A0A5J6N2L0_9PROT|nr:alpha/beta hydrolase [Hypericibacter adhaerens]QEX24192.1 3-oxoadipate enol-lactonase [Hypericibacter adhaerens]HWA41926.1 alpha/beta hydrolase [Hypericibacter adhaerens]
MSTQTIERMAVEVEGEGDPIILVHGLGGSSNTWTPQLGILAGRYRIIRPDLQGSGRSPLGAGPLSVDGFADSLIRMAKVLGVERAHFAGHSLGTIILEKIAIAEPRLVRSLTLCGPLLAPPDQGRQGLKDRAAKARAEGMADIADAVLAGAVSAHSKQANPVALAAARESLMRQCPQGYAATCEALAAVEAADVTRITAPTLLIAGENDPVAPPSIARTIADRIKGARVHVLPRIAHWTTFEAAAEVNALMKDFLAAQR